MHTTTSSRTILACSLPRAGRFLHPLSSVLTGAAGAINSSNPRRQRRRHCLPRPRHKPGHPARPGEFLAVPLTPCGVCKVFNSPGRAAGRCGFTPERCGSRDRGGAAKANGRALARLSRSAGVRCNLSQRKPSASAARSVGHRPARRRQGWEPEGARLAQRGSMAKPHQPDPGRPGRGDALPGVAGPPRQPRRTKRPGGCQASDLHALY